MPLILGTNSIKDTGYNVANSVRLNAGDNPSGSVTQGTPTNVDKYTFSVWVKRADIGASNSKIFSVSSGSTYGEEKLEFNNDDLIWRHTQASDGETVWQRVTDRKFRDPSAWYNIIVAYDSSQGTAVDRCKMYINGVQETSFSGSSNPSSGLDSYTNTSGRALKFFALHENVNSQNAGAYFAEMVYVDGQQLDQTSFGEFDSDSPNIWKPIDVSELTFGNNGFYLDFEDGSALGNDVSGNNNDVTFSNIASTDQSTDTCTNNFATMNPLDNYYASNTYSEGNIKFVTKASGGFAYGTSTIGLSSGKWYAEFDCIATTDSGAYHQVGIVEKPSASTTTSATANIGSSAYSWGYYAADGKSRNSASYSTYGDSWTTGNIIGVYLNLDDNELRFSKDGVIQNSGTAISITAPASNGTGHYFITAGGMSTNASVTFEANFGNPFQSQSSSVSDANGYGAFEYSPTLSGVNYYSINTKNLAEFG